MCGGGAEDSGGLGSVSPGRWRSARRMGDFLVGRGSGWRSGDSLDRRVIDRRRGDYLLSMGSNLREVRSLVDRDSGEEWWVGKINVGFERH